MREASTLMLQIVSQGHVAEGGESLRSNVVHDDGDAKTMFAAEDVLEKGRLSRALKHSQRRKHDRRTRREADEKAGEKCHGQSLGRDARFLCALALGALLDAILGHFDEISCVRLEKSQINDCRR